MRTIELLSPAKNLTCGIEAIRHGADAVYIGAERFGARAAAGNSIEDISELCAFAHQFRAKVYVTVNTILYDDELEATRALIQRLHAIGVDALITQDMSLLSMSLPPIPLHASTQMDNQMPEKVAWLSGLGYEQVVLARELSLSQIRAIHDRCPGTRLEAFVHGALCVSYSGRCYASQHCFGRSANRGECAQFCRLAFDLLDAGGRPIARDRHLLSLRDMNRAGHLEEMIDAGVSSMKIEGRLKDVSYVKNITAYYRQQLDAIISRRPDLCRSSIGTSTYTFTPNPAKSFNRGFTDYFLKEYDETSRGPLGNQASPGSHRAGSTHRSRTQIWNPATPKATGEPIGHLKEIRHERGGLCLVVSSTAAFANGDGLCYIDADGHLQGFRVNRANGNHLYPQASTTLNIKKGTPLFRNYDAAFEQLLAKASADRRIHVRWRLTDTADNSPYGGFTLYLTSEDGITVSLPISHPHEKANSPQKENIHRQLSRLGNTIYESLSIDIHYADNWFLPSSILSEARRTLVERLDEARRTHINATPGHTLPADVASNSSEGSDHAPILPTDYTANVSNHLARNFYASQGIPGIAPAYEQAPPHAATIMTCRHCVRFALGYCPKQGTDAPAPRLPWSLALPDGRRFPLHFDCQRCEMQVRTQ